MLEMVHNRGCSRIPVYENNVDNIVGVLYVKDLLQLIGGRKCWTWPKSCGRPISCEAKKINQPPGSSATCTCASSSGSAAMSGMFTIKKTSWRSSWAKPGRVRQQFSRC
jgi:hypothetical protein